MVTTVQCARVDTMPNTVGRANLPTVNDKSTTAACVECRPVTHTFGPSQ
jgi:hypothetical protein